MTAIKGVFYARYMDDWVVLCKTRHQLRNVVKRTYQVLDKLKLKIHPDKIDRGKIEKGFAFLGYHFRIDTFSVATVTLERALSKLRQLYEQGATIKRLAQYWQRLFTMSERWHYSSASWGPATARAFGTANGRPVHQASVRRPCSPGTPALTVPPLSSTGRLMTLPYRFEGSVPLLFRARTYHAVTLFRCRGRIAHDIKLAFVCCLLP